MIAPGEAPRRLPGAAAEAHQRGLQKCGIFFVARPADQMGLSRRVAEIIAESAGPGVRPIDDLIDRLQPFCIVRKFAYFSESEGEPGPVVDRYVDGIQVRPASDGNGLITRYGEVSALIEHSSISVS